MRAALLFLLAYNRRFVRSTVARGWLAATAIVSLALVLGSPLVGALQLAVRAWTGAHYVAVVAGVAIATAAAAIAVAVRRITHDAPRRFALIGAAVALAGGYLGLTRTGDASVDVVESIHFVEYGLVTLLAYHAFRHCRDAAAVVLPLLIGLLVGIADESLQWFVPGRVGELRDIFLNLVAVVCGLLFSVGLSPLPGWSPSATIMSRRWMGGAAVAVVLAATAFVHAVHAGVEIADPSTGVFRSRYDATTLLHLSAERRAVWAARSPAGSTRYSREDRYYAEAIAHVRQRNRLWDAGDPAGALQEQRILERYFAPILELGHAWPPTQRGDAETRAGATVPAASDALGYPVLLWSPWWLWAMAISASAVILRRSTRAD